MQILRHYNVTAEDIFPIVGIGGAFSTFRGREAGTTEEKWTVLLLFRKPEALGESISIWLKCQVYVNLFGSSLEVYFIKISRKKVWLNRSTHNERGFAI